MEQSDTGKSSVWILLTLILFFIGFGIGAIFFLPPYLRDANDSRLLTEGIPAEARILGYRDNENRFNYGLEFFAIVEIQLPGDAPYRAEIISSGGEYLPGAVVPVRVDPNDPQNVVFQGGSQ